MPVVASVDYPNKRIFLHADTVGVDLDTIDVYREVRERRRTNEADRRFKPMIIAGGNIEKISGQTFTPRFVQLLFGCRIVPFDTTQQLRLIRDTFTDDGFAGRDCFDRSSLSPTTQVDIDVDFPEIEIRVVTVGGANVITGDIADVGNAVLTAAQAAPIHANIKYVNDEEIAGNGRPGSPWGPI